MPVGALASVDGDTIQLQGVIAAPDGSRVLRVSASGTDAQSLGETLAQNSLSKGANDLLTSTAVVK